MRTRTLSMTMAAIAASALLSGCVATLGDLQQGADNIGKSVISAVTPADVTAYKEFNSRNFVTLNAVVAEAKKVSGLAFPKADLGKIKFRDSIGRVFDVDAINTFRFPLPQDALDADSAQLTPLMVAIGARMLEWNRGEPIELITVSASSDSADLMATQLKKSVPGIKVTTKVGPVATVGYAGVELRMINTAPVRVTAK